MLIGIEGPAGAGKSTMARTVAPEFDAVVLEGGAWYRSLTYAAQKHRVTPDDEAALLTLADQMELDFRPDKITGGYRLYLEGHDVTAELQKESVFKAVASYAQVLPVRKIIDKKMHLAVEKYDSILFVGRHLQQFIPNASVLYLAISEAEAQRRHVAQMGGEAVKLEPRNSIDRSVAITLGISIKPGQVVDVTDMTRAEQADLLRRFIKQNLN